jgi:hypothetical protein
MFKNWTKKKNFLELGEGVKIERGLFSPEKRRTRSEK